MPRHRLNLDVRALYARIGLLLVFIRRFALLGIRHGSLRRRKNSSETAASIVPCDR
jgi:hypothetical protein